MNCKKFRKQYVQLLDADIGAAIDPDLAAHLETCPKCARFYEEMLRSLTALQPARKITASPQFKEQIMNRIDKTDQTRNRKPARLATLHIKWWKPAFAAGAVAIVVVVLLLTGVFRSGTTAYAIEQIVEALESVQFMHTVSRKNAGQSKDERWIAIGTDGFQARYRQDTPSGDFFVVDDRQTVLVHHKDKNTVVLYDPKDKQYQWIGDLGGYFRSLAGTGSVTIEENVDYKGRKAHRVRWLALDLDCYIDPESKLPIAMSGYEISYEDPPEGTFSVVIPDGVTLVDKRSKAGSTEDPEWMKQQAIANKDFPAARHALTAGEYERAAELFKKVVEIQPRRNWAWFWMGKAQYELGEYDQAIFAFTKVIDMFGDQWPCLYCHLARGMAYRRSKMPAMATRDFAKALPNMVLALRHIEEGSMFDYAEDPLHRGSRKQTKEQSFARMIERLREVTGQNFGYDPEGTPEHKKEVISAWEQWWEEHAEEYGASN